MDNLIKRVENEKVVLSIYFDSCPTNPREWDNLGTMVCGHRRYDLGDEQAQNIGLYNSWDEWLENEIIKPNGGEENVVYLPLYLYDHGGITMNTTGFSCPWDSGQVGWIYATKDRFREETGYTDDELFNQDKHRIPKVGERVKVKGYEDWGQVKAVDEETITVDLDWNKIPNARKPENILVVTIGDIEKVMANKAIEILENKVRIYDDYLRGEVYRFILEEKKTCDCCGHVKYEKIDSCWGFYGYDSIEFMKYEIPKEYRNLFEEVV